MTVLYGRVGIPKILSCFVVGRAGSPIRSARDSYNNAIDNVLRNSRRAFFCLAFNFE